MGKQRNMVNMSYVQEQVNNLVEVAKLIDCHLPYLKKGYGYMIDLSVETHVKSHEPIMPVGLTLIFSMFETLRNKILELQSFNPDCSDKEFDDYMRNLLILTMENKLLKLLTQYEFLSDHHYSFIHYVASSSKTILDILYDIIFSYFYNGDCDE